MPSMMRDAGMMTGRTARPSRIASTTTGCLPAGEDMQEPEVRDAPHKCHACGSLAWPSPDMQHEKALEVVLVEVRVQHEEERRVVWTREPMQADQQKMRGRYELARALRESCSSRAPRASCSPTFSPFVEPPREASAAGPSCLAAWPTPPSRCGGGACRSTRVGSAARASARLPAARATRWR
jgi:hypothetical protein